MGYTVRSNQEQGLGRSDITVLDRKNRRVTVIEARRSAFEAQMKQDRDAALARMETMQYADALYCYRMVLRYGVRSIGLFFLDLNLDVGIIIDDETTNTTKKRRGYRPRVPHC